MLTVALGAVLERHIERAAPGDLGLWTLRGLEVLEPALKGELRSGTLLLSAGDRLLAARPMPPATAPDAAAQPLAVGLAALYAAAWEVSPLLRRAGPERMLRSGFEELFNHLDPYSRYLTPEEAEAARGRRVGQVGLGLRLAAGRGGEVILATVGPGGPAVEAGLRPGDRVLAIDGQPISADDLATAALLLEGPAGTEVAIRLQRGRRRFQVRLLRSLLPPETVHAERQEDILWIRLQNFSTATDRLVTSALADGFRPEGPRANRPRGVVLDLRGNRGGLLGQAVAVAGAFLEEGIVAQTAGRHPDAARIYRATLGDRAEGAPLVVLVDGRTASAAEIVAAALADRGRGVVVGSATTGKGLVQVVVPLPNGGELLVTWSRVLAPRGWPLQDLGVLPALCTSLGAEAVAGELARLRAGNPPMAAALARQRAARAPVPASELAALRDTCPPAEGRPLDATLARQLIQESDLYEAALAR
ncbi:PDZ domain-containing protein [Belnapia sp. T6]|uniref:PDZ domain-containing protein n=1 Tax=Belnapia mucosa TaxID=2804532 RepID=A0ABS1V541_9PROT|nr:S41 family peptidase [Belnapia mucosa]MBL6456810.1 PDZ domain-containing protein [Belnapia mucosa]